MLVHTERQTFYAPEGNGRILVGIAGAFHLGRDLRLQLVHTRIGMRPSVREGGLVQSDQMRSD